MIVLNFIKEYWVIISFFVAELGVIYVFISTVKKALKCLLRKHILDIYDKCRVTGEITMYQLQCLNYMYDLYKKFKGNSFVDTIVKDEIPTFKIIK